MKQNKLLTYGFAFMQAKFLRRALPLIVGWALTYRCNNHCAYCSLWQQKLEELSTNDIYKVMDTLAHAGAKFISFTGGEPLLRDDIGLIIDYAHQKGIETKLNSNGLLVKEKIEQLRNLDALILSLEGPEDIHDAIRHEGSFKSVLEAASVAKRHGIRIGFSTVLTALNLTSLDFILKQAKLFDAQVNFQPALSVVLGGAATNPLAPQATEYRFAVQALIKKKKQGDRQIGNSLSGMLHLLHWPYAKKMHCASGRLSCRIEPNGDVVYCSRDKRPSKVMNCLREGFPKAFLHLSSFACNDCWCAGRVELNLALNANASSIISHIQSLWKKK